VVVAARLVSQVARRSIVSVAAEVPSKVQVKVPAVTNTAESPVLNATASVPELFRIAA
jgi:hypothetical protein